MHVDRIAARRAFANVQSWGCQYQNIDLDTLVASKLDLIVIEHVLDGGTQRRALPQDVARLKLKSDGGRRLVFAYLSLGEAESYRPYWQPNWGQTPPDWISNGNAEWPGAYLVQYWRKEWQSVSFDGPGSLLEPILDAGYDGVFLDRIDAYMQWQSRRASAAEDMITQVERLAEIARVRRPGFLLIGQNAEPLLKSDRYRRLIDAVSKESLLYGLAGKELRNAASDIAWSRDGLDAARGAGLPILTIEYVDRPGLAADVEREHRSLGYVPFIGTRALDGPPGRHLLK